MILQFIVFQGFSYIVTLPLILSNHALEQADNLNLECRQNSTEMHILRFQEVKSLMTHQRRKVITTL